MALISKNNITKSDKERNSVHEVVESTYSVFEKYGEKFFQLDTYGSPDRKLKGKISQSIQLDKDSAEFLVKTLRNYFNI